MVSYVERVFRYFLIGRDVGFFDKLIYHLSFGNSSGWVIGNKLRRIVMGGLKGTYGKNLILIGGYPRSGTTLTDALLNQHPNIVSPDKEVNIIEDLHSLRVLREVLKLDKAVVQKVLKERNLVRAAVIAIDAFQKKFPGKRIMLKQPKHVFFLDEIFRHFPKAKYINVLRDGRDATMSQKDYCLYERVTEWPYDWCVRQWVVAVNRADKFKRHPRYIETRYEDLVTDPINEVGRILDFLGEKRLQKTKILNYYKSTFGKYPTHDNIQKPLDKTIIGKGLRRMGNKHKKIFKDIAGKSLIEKGYVEDSDW